MEFVCSVVTAATPAARSGSLNAALVSVGGKYKSG